MSLIVQTEDEYEDLLSLWSDLESGLAMALTYPQSVQEFAQRIVQYDHWMRELLSLDTDVSLYLLFQLATKSPVGYSPSHALVCGVLCDLLATEFALPQPQRDSLVRAALTMNLSMTLLQNEMATQAGRPSNEQQHAIDEHAGQSVALLKSKGIDDALWLEVVQFHHTDEDAPKKPLNMLVPSRRLAYILQVVDRYAAMISPRETREGRSSADSAENILRGTIEQSGTVGQALVQVVGLCPPGTFVQLSDGQIAIITRRSQQPNQPDVVVIMDAQGKLLRAPMLHKTAGSEVGIHSALLASAVKDRINHHQILQISSA